MRPFIDPIALLPALYTVLDLFVFAFLATMYIAVGPVFIKANFEGNRRGCSETAKSPETNCTHTCDEDPVEVDDDSLLLPRYVQELVREGTFTGCS